MGRLAHLLRIADAGPSESKKLIERYPTSTSKDKKIKKLLLSTKIEETTLVQEAVYEQVIAGAEPHICFREVLPVYKTDRYALRVVKGEKGAYAEEVAEGAEVPIKTQDYQKVRFDVKKIGTRPAITQEMIDDALFDVVELELEKAGRRLENKLNRDCIREILKSQAGSLADIDPAGTTLAVTDITDAMRTVKAKGYFPDALILHPRAEGQLLRDSNLVYVNQAGTDVGLRRASIGDMLMGMKPWALSVTTGWTTDYWDETDAANHYYALVMDSKAAGAICLRKDITVQKYFDPIRDLHNIVCTMRYDVKQIHPDAFVRILTK